MEPSSPWLDIHRARGPRQTDEDEPVSGSSDSDDETSDDTVTSDVENVARTNPWDGVETARRPSQSTVDLPSPDQSADD